MAAAQAGSLDALESILTHLQPNIEARNMASSAQRIWFSHVDGVEGTNRADHGGGL